LLLAKENLGLFKDLLLIQGTQ
jgi:hypothetical protein